MTSSKKFIMVDSLESLQGLDEELRRDQLRLYRRSQIFLYAGSASLARLVAGTSSSSSIEI
jgi:hypothetical protein